jgi:hypothetical protein
LLAVTVLGTLGIVPPAFAATDVLTESEKEGLIYMREEEKLAHDVYVTLYAKWGLPVFNNIARSETTHTSAVQILLDRYGIPDPTVGNGTGEFTDPTLQGLYDQLVAQGSKSLADALKVGAAIEEIDILDLQTRLAQTDQADIERVYSNLLKGSQNHLRAFTSTLQQQTGETYKPQYLDDSTYNLMIAGTSTGRGGRRWGNR